jgi:histidinol dehydrogenase
MERFKKDMRVFIDDALKSHEKSFDAMSRDNLDNIKEQIKEQASLDVAIKERMGQIKEVIRKEHEKIEENKNEIRKFKEYIIAYMNDLLSTYENRFGMLKKDIEYSMERILKG